MLCNPRVRFWKKNKAEFIIGWKNHKVIICTDKVRRINRNMNYITGATLVQMVEKCVENVEIIERKWAKTRQNELIFADMEPMEIIPDSS